MHARQSEEIPPELELLLAGLPDEQQRMAVIHAYYNVGEGDPATWPVQFAVLIKAHTLAMARATTNAPDTLQANQLQIMKAAQEIQRNTEVLVSVTSSRVRLALSLFFGFGLFAGIVIGATWQTFYLWLRGVGHF